MSLDRPSERSQSTSSLFTSSLVSALCATLAPDGNWAVTAGAEHLTVHHLSAHETGRVVVCTQLVVWPRTLILSLQVASSQAARLTEHKQSTFVAVACGKVPIVATDHPIYIYLQGTSTSIFALTTAGQLCVFEQRNRNKAEGKQVGSWYC